MKVFVDLDGVLCDFEKGVRTVFDGRGPKEIPLKDMWRRLARTDDFYATLDWMADGRDLWEGVKHLNPTILTGIPMGNWAPKQKRVWCGRNLGWEVPVITCFAREKQLHGKPGDVLIDDTVKNGLRWSEMGGNFILHTQTSRSLQMLEKMLNG